MNLIVTAFEGQLAAAPDYQETPNGTPVCTAVVLINRRTKQAGGRWVDAEPTRRRLKAWRANARRLAQLRRGDTVVVIGSIETEAWTDTETGAKRTTETVTVDAIGKGLLLPRTDVDEHLNITRHTTSDTTGEATDEATDETGDETAEAGGKAAGE